MLPLHGNAVKNAHKFKDGCISQGLQIDLYNMEANGCLEGTQKKQSKIYRLNWIFESTHLVHQSGV